MVGAVPIHAAPEVTVPIPGVRTDAALMPVAPAAIAPIHGARTDVALTPVARAVTALIRGARDIVAETDVAPLPDIIHDAGNTRSAATTSIATNAGIGRNDAGFAT